MTARDRWKQIQAVLGTVEDGIPGTKDDHALKTLRASAVSEYQASKVTVVSGIPKDDEASIRAVYGPPGDSRLTTFDLPYPMRIAWDTDTVVRKATCHELCKDDLISILGGILNHYGHLDNVKRHRMDLFGGIYNYRKMRGGTSWSRHAWGIAIDIDPDRNGLNTAWPGSATMPEEVIRIFEKHGWKSYARSMGRDAMHFQRTQ